MKLTGKILRLVNATVVITLFLSTLNVSAVNTHESFSLMPEPVMSRESYTPQPVFKEVSLESPCDYSALHGGLP